VVLDNLSSGHRYAVRWGPLEVGDIADEDLIRHVIEKYRISGVIHFAANAYVGESMKNPRQYFENNVMNSLRLLDAMLDRGIDRIVFSSTCATYGVPVRVPIDEVHPQLPVNPYGESKLFLEKTLRWYGEAHGMRSLCLRYFNAAEADPDGELGECHDPETHLVPLVIQAAICEKAVAVYGTDYPTPDGTAVRDFIHVSDLADAHVRALRYLAGGGKSTSINLGTGIGHSVRQVIRTVERVSRRPVRVVECPRRAGDSSTLVACADKARELLEWTPRFKDLGELADTALRWHCSERSALAAAV
jgi:UDP-arabinose 4-epimerase